MTNSLYTQTLLSQDVSSTLSTFGAAFGGTLTRHITLWIPRERAVIGRQVRVKSEAGTWEVWTVEHVYATKPEAFVRERSQDYRNQRDVSDV